MLISPWPIYRIKVTWKSRCISGLIVNSEFSNLYIYYSLNRVGSVWLLRKIGFREDVLFFFEFVEIFFWLSRQLHVYFSMDLNSFSNFSRGYHTWRNDIVKFYKIWISGLGGDAFWRILLTTDVRWTPGTCRSQ